LFPMTPAWEPLRALVPAHPWDLVLFGALLASLLPAAEAKRPGRTRLVLLGKPDIPSGEREREVIRCRDLLGKTPGPAASEPDP